MLNVVSLLILPSFDYNVIFLGNKYYFEHVQQHPRVILEEALSFLAEYQRLLATMTDSY